MAIGLLKGNHMFYPGYFVGLLILILDIYVIYLVLTGSGEPRIKLLWIIIVVVLPLIGPILYFLLGRGNKLA